MRIWTSGGPTTGCECFTVEFQTNNGVTHSAATPREMSIRRVLNLATEEIRHILRTDVDDTENYEWKPKFQPR